MPGYKKSNENLNSNSALTTLWVSVVLFLVVQAVFEYYRSYKQIYLKRSQKRFLDIGRVPPEPQRFIFGWLVSISRLSETDVLQMVGLDAFMLLRYMTVCFKLSLFMSLWGLLILVPLYSTAAGKLEWDKYTLSNVISASNDSKYRLWAAAIFGYIFAAYFCQLMYSEYNKFSVNRLKYLVQADPDSPQGDPDTPPQKYFTVMVERIPGHLRSAPALRKFFENLFPDEVHSVEVALDLRELDYLNSQRKSVRNNLEKSIAVYEATNKRPTVYIQTNNFTKFSDDTMGMAAESATWDSFFKKLIAPEKYGYEKLDALNYYTKRLDELNDKMRQLQERNVKFAVNSDKELERKIRKRYDTRAAAVMETGYKFISETKKKSRGIDQWLFGGDDYQSALQLQLEKVEHVAILPSPRNVPPESRPATQEAAPRQVEHRDSIVEKTGPSLSDFLTENPMHGSRVARPVASNNSVVRISASSSNGTSVTPVDLSFSPATEETIQRGSVPEALFPFKPLAGETGNEAVTKSLDSVFEAVQSNGDTTKLARTRSFIDASCQENGYSAVSMEDPIIAPRASFVASGSGIKKSRSSSCLTETTSSVKTEATIDSVKRSDSASTLPTKGLEREESIFNPLFDRANFAAPSALLTAEQREQANQLAKESYEKARQATKQGWAQTKIAGSGAIRGLIEVERAFEMLTFGAYYKYSTTAFVTFKTRVTESVAHQMLLSHDAMEISHAPNPKDIIWENVAIPKSQVKMRHFIVNAGLCVGSLFWSSLVNAVNHITAVMDLSEFQQGYASVIIMLIFLFSLPVIFDALARNYEGLKLESEIQNTIMTRYFYYQLVNIYVTVGMGTDNFIAQIFEIMRTPQILVDILSKTVPSMSLYFLTLVIVKIFLAVPLEMIRPWQLSTILTMGTCMDRRQCTRRELRTGAFYPWPMLYGWVYPQLMLVFIVQVTYSCIAPLLMPLCALFHVFAYLMYKYQLLFVYINDYQSGGFMWYAVFSRSMIAMIFASLTLLGYLSLELSNTYLAGPFYFFLPAPFCLWYFWKYTEGKFMKPSMNLSLVFAKELDIRDRERAKEGKPVPHNVFKQECYRQPSLTEGAVLPEPYRADGTFDFLMDSSESGKIFEDHRNRRGSISINVNDVTEEGEENEVVLKAYMEEVVKPLSKIPSEVDENTANVENEQVTRRRSRIRKGMSSFNKSLTRAASHNSLSRLLFDSDHCNGGGEPSRSFSFRLWQVLVMVIRLITPASYAFLFLIWARPIHISYLVEHYWLGSLALWAFVEAMFLPAYFLLFLTMNKRNPGQAHLASTKYDRRRLVFNCMESITSTIPVDGSRENHLRNIEEYTRQMLKGWFFGAEIHEIYLRNMESWCSWAFFAKESEELTEEERRENLEYIELFEFYGRCRFMPGLNKNVDCARLTLDPVFATQRPFIVYFTVAIVNWVAHCLLWFLGFRKRWNGSSPSQLVYHRLPASLNKRHAKHPIVLVHGIGIGFALYVGLIAMLPRDVDVYLVEWPHVAMQLFSSRPLSEDQSVEALIAVLAADGHPKACFVSHSLGSTFISWLLHHPTGRLFVGSTLLIDPVTMMLLDPKVATSFVYHEPETTTDFVRHFFVSRELHISHALSRHFNWSHNIMFVEELTSYSPTGQLITREAFNDPEKFKDLKKAPIAPLSVEPTLVNHTIVLAKEDPIVPVPLVERYLNAKAKQGFSCFEVLLFNGTHGEVMVHSTWLRLLVEKIKHKIEIKLQSENS